MFRGAKLMGLLALVLSFAAQAHADSTRRIVVFSPAVPQTQRLALAKTSGAQIVRELPMIHAVVIESPVALMAAAEEKLAQLPEVTRIDLSPRVKWIRGADFRVPPTGAIIERVRALKSPPPAAPTPVPDAQKRDWGIDKVEAPAAWSRTRGQGVKVVVIDTGVDRTHPDLVTKGGWNAVAKNDDYNDDNGHGSHVAGTIAAQDNKIGSVGVAPEVDLYGVKVLDANGSGTFDDVIAGMQWAVDNKMDVANMSLGADAQYGNESLKAAVAAMADNGVTLVAAAGNSGGPVGVPAAYPGAVAVAASTRVDGVAYFSSRGPEVAVIAPGMSIYSTYMGGGYDTLSGTSMACPHVAGLAALHIATHKGASPKAVADALRAASVKLAGVPDEAQGAGLPKAPKLLK